MLSSVYHSDFEGKAKNIARVGDIGSYTLVAKLCTYRNEANSTVAIIPTIICYVSRRMDPEQIYDSVATVRFVFHKKQGWITPDDERLIKFITHNEIIAYKQENVEELVKELRLKNFKHLIQPRNDENAATFVPEIKITAIEKKIASKEKKKENYMSKNDISKFCHALAELLPETTQSPIENPNAQIASNEIKQAIEQIKSEIKDENAYEKLKELYKISLKIADTLVKEATNTDESLLAINIRNFLEQTYPEIAKQVQAEISSAPTARL